MSRMFSMKECKERKRLCIHEKTVSAIVVLVGLWAMGHWFLNWF